MQGRSATLLLLTLATFLDELLHLAGILSSEHTSKQHSSHLRYHSSSLYTRPRWWPVLAAAGSPVTQPESQIQPIISQLEQDTAEIIRNGDAHTTQTRWTIAILDPNPQPESQRLLAIEENELDVRPGSNAPMGWADPRLRGGQMLDVRLSAPFFCSHKPPCIIEPVSLTSYHALRQSIAHVLTLTRSSSPQVLASHST
jgi:hypothetical protein